ncbi:MAG: rhodanese-like domain-containing protein [Saprospiraceae bacterium]
MKEITVQDLKKMMDEGANFQLIDVREQHEYDLGNIGGEHIPLGTIPSNIDKISTEKPVIMQCRSGGRSGQAVMFLEQTTDLKNLHNLTGGIMAWQAEIDSSVKY